MRDGDGMHRPFELAAPEVEEILEDGKARRDVVLLPDKGLQHAAMIRHAVQDRRGRQPVAFQLPDEIR